MRVIAHERNVYFLDYVLVTVFARNVSNASVSDLNENCFGNLHEVLVGVCVRASERTPLMS